MKALEILARGPSRKPPNPDYDHWWLSTAFPNDREIRQAERVFSLHGDSLLEPWLPDDIRTVVMPGTISRPGAQFINRDNYIKRYGQVFACSVSWMIAMAIEADYRLILLNGVDHLRPNERQERESIAYMLGRANGEGILLNFYGDAGINLNFGAYPG